MELGELVSVVVGDAASGDCPFEHEPVEHDMENVLPPPETKNDATKLSEALDAASLHLETMDIEVDGRPERVHFSAHHLLPGNESWPKTQLKKWIDKRDGHVCGDVGYDVNEADNGVDLPSHVAASSWVSPGFQGQYAFAAMLADGQGRQFHDRHNAYSGFVVKVLDRIAATLDSKETPGCGKRNCGGGKQKPFDPPYGLVNRIRALAGRLRPRLLGGSDTWEAPIMTSRFALMLKNQASGMTQAEARAALKASRFDYSSIPE